MQTQKHKSSFILEFLDKALHLSQMQTLVRTSQLIHLLLFVFLFF